MGAAAPGVVPGLPAPAGGDPAVRTGRQPLWLAVHLPWLAGEVLADGRSPLAVCEESRRGWLIHQVCPEGRRRGVWPGMTTSAAGVMCPALTVRRRRPQREARRLAEIGGWMDAFSPVVSVQAPATVLLEVRGSLGLFGGVERLKAQITARLDAAGHVHRIAGAPAPAAARCLARWGRDVVVTQRADLRSVLGDMPIGLLALDAKTARRLARAGLRVLRDLWRLPADGLARRFGAGLARELDRLQGRHPDPQPLFQSAPRFCSALMLDWATDDLAQLTQAVDHLLRQWVDDLRGSARGTSGFRVECLLQRGGERVGVNIGLRRITREAPHLRRLAAEHMSRLELPGPVEGVVLSSECMHPLPERSGQLFETPEEAQMQWRQGEELLAGRLGGRGLEGLRALADHRPERAWGRATEASGEPHTGGRVEDDAAARHRPLWLLDEPRPLPWPDEPAGGEGRPRLLRGPERIETGWWDRRDQRRDYYVAVDPRGRRLWVFRDLRGGQWYLHGLFA